MVEVNADVSLVSPVPLPRCTTCGHFACPCCRDWCDDLDCECDSGSCTYAEPYPDALDAFQDQIEAKYEDPELGIAAGVWQTDERGFLSFEPDLEVASDP